MDDEPEPQKVVVSDIQMRFGSMVLFMVKWAIAAIPALVILIFLGVAVAVFAGGLLASLGRVSPTQSSTPIGLNPPSTGTTTHSSMNVAYLDKVEVRKLTVGQSVLGGPGVFGEIKNTGDRALKEVEITIYCLGREGQAVFEKTYHPVLVSSIGFGDANQPLKPGYSRQFGVKLDDAPSEWARKVKVRVTGVEFQ